MVKDIGLSFKYTMCRLSTSIQVPFLESCAYTFRFLSSCLPMACLTYTVSEKFVIAKPLLPVGFHVLVELARREPGHRWYLWFARDDA